MRVLLAWSLMAVLPGVVAAAVLDVFPDGSGAYPDLQQALLAAGQGDTIRLADGLYSGSQNRNLVLGGQELTFLAAGGDPTACILDVEGDGRGFLVFSTSASNITLEGLTIRNGNPADLPEDQLPGYGGAIAIESLENGGNVRLFRCILEDNLAAAGAGAFIWESEATFESCVFRNNTATDGAGVYCGYCTAGTGPNFVFCLFFGNDFPQEDVGGYGAGIYFSHSVGAVTNCTFADNRAWLGAGLLVSTESSVEAANCLVAFNSMGEGVAVHNGVIHLARTDIFGNAGGDWVGEIAGQLGSECNVAVDPQFCEPGQDDYSLNVSSPCLPENNDCEVLIGALGNGCGPSGIRDDGFPPRMAWLGQIFPNPFNPTTTIGYGLLRSTPVTLKLFDSKGRVVRTLRNAEVATAGDHEVIWDGRDDRGRLVPTGIYLLCLSAGDYTETKKMALIR